MTHRLLHPVEKDDTGDPAARLDMSHVAQTTLAELYQTLWNAFDGRLLPLVACRWHTSKVNQRRVSKRKCAQSIRLANNEAWWGQPVRLA
jgi:hypothetical protein